MLEICLFSHTKCCLLLLVPFGSFTYSRKIKNAREHSGYHKSAIAALVLLGTWNGAWHGYRLVQVTFSQDIPSSETSKIRSHCQVKVCIQPDTKRGQWHGQNPLVPAGIIKQCQTCWVTVSDVATTSMWSERILFITALLCRKEMRLENGGLHSNSCQPCQGVYLWHCNYRSITSEKRSDIWISPLQLPQISAFVQPRDRNLL